MNHHTSSKKKPLKERLETDEFTATDIEFMIAAKANAPAMKRLLKEIDLNAILEKKRQAHKKSEPHYLGPSAAPKQSGVIKSALLMTGTAAG
jgi:hypothetical protein